MKPADEREELLLHEALKRASEPERQAFLDGACGGNPELRATLEACLRARESSCSGPAAPAAAVVHETAVLPPEESPGTLIGRYRIFEKIGEGGFGTVYVAEQREPVKRRVALKIIKLGMDTRQVVGRFEAERQALALMDHPNIAKVLDAGATETGRPYFVMELVRGIPITRYCEQQRMEMTERLRLFIQICHAIQHAHQKGIIHRDIKPSNILVTLHDGVPVPKVIDFGIAKATQVELTEKTVYTQFQQFIGTPTYMSPEQAEMSGLDIDTRSDIYSLGVILYELLTGSTPFDTQELLQSGLDEMRRIILEREPVRPSTRITQHGKQGEGGSASGGGRPPVDSDLDWIVMKCLEKDRTRRYETANAVAMDIERHLKHEPVLARPPSVRYRLQKSLRRNRVVFTAAGVVALALVLGVVISTWEATRATRARRNEAAARGRADEAARVAETERQRAEKGEQKAKASEMLARQNLYAADMNLAYQACQEKNLGRAVELLNRHRPGPHETDFRGWEWRYLWGLCRSEALYSLGQHSNVCWGVYGMAMSPDDRYLATTDVAGGEVRLWDTESRRTIEVLETNDASGSLAFSPDGKVLAFATGHRGVRLWNIQAHREVGHYPASTADFCSGPLLGFSPDGRELAIGENDGQVRLWDLSSEMTNGPRLKLDAHRPGVQALYFSPGGQTLVTAGSLDDHRIRIWSVATGELLASLTNNTTRIGGVVLSPDGGILATGDWDARIRILDLARHCQVAVLTNHTFWISALAFSADGKTLASASADYSLKLWDTCNWQEVRTLKGSQNEVWGVVFSHDGKMLFSGSKGGKILAWDARPHAVDIQVLRRPEDARDFFLFSSGIPFCVHTNQTFNLWDPKTLRKLPEQLATDWVIWTNSSSTALSPGMERIAVATRSGRIYLLDTQGKRQKPVAGLPFDAQGLEFSPDGKFLAAASRTGVTVWNLENLEVTAALPKSDWALGCGPCFASDGELVAVGSEGGYVELWDLGRKQRVAGWQAHKAGFTGMAFTPDGKRLVTAHYDSKVRLWDLESRQESVPLGQTLNAYFSVAVSHDGQRIAAGTAGKDGQIKIWNSATGQELVTLKGINDWVDPNAPNHWGLGVVVGLAFLPQDGNTLISSTSQEVRLWRAPSWAEIEAAERNME